MSGADPSVNFSRCKEKSFFSEPDHQLASDKQIIRLKQKLVEKEIQLTELRSRYEELSNRSYCLKGVFKRLGFRLIVRGPVRRFLLTVLLFRYRKVIQRSGLFDESYYLDQHSEIKQSGEDPLTHFIFHSGHIFHRPSSDFDSLKYYSHHPEIRSSLFLNPLIHYLRNGFIQDRPQTRIWSQNQIQSLVESIRKVTTNQPLVSIVIPLQKEVSFLLQCLASIFSAPTSLTYEVIVPQDNSIYKPVLELLADAGIKFCECESNFDFVTMCNSGAREAFGTYLIFLKETDKVMPGWLDELIRVFDTVETVGAVGPKILYPHGRVNETGRTFLGYAGFLKNGDLKEKDSPECSFLREVDFCSVNSLMVRTEQFCRLKGLDSSFSSEDAAAADLAHRLMVDGFNVFCNPLSQIVSHTLISCGEQLFPEKDAESMAGRWQLNVSTPLPAKFPAASSSPLRRCAGRRMLVIDRTPKPDNDAGSVVSFHFIKIFIQLGYQVTFMPDDLRWQSGYTSNLQRIGVECLYQPYVKSAYDYLVVNGARFDVVFLHRVHVAGKYINIIHQYCPLAKIIFLVADLHWLREERQAAIELSATLLATAKKTKQLELAVIRKSDVVVVHSEVEYHILQQEVKSVHVQRIPLLFDIPGCRKTFAEREGILFIGGYRHKPNVDAVLTFVNNVWPILRQRIDELVFYIIGSHVPESIASLDGNGIRVVGYVENLDDYFDRCRLSVVPLRYGAGIKGKLGTSLSYGMPAVSTTVGIEGMPLEDGRNVLVAKIGHEFAEAVERLYNDENLWSLLSSEGLRFVRDHYSFDAGKKYLANLLKSIDRYSERERK